MRDVSCGTDDGLIGGATILLFNSKKQLKTGKQKLRLWPRKKADGSFPTTTPGKVFVSLSYMFMDVSFNILYIVRCSSKFDYLSLILRFLWWLRILIGP